MKIDQTILASDPKRPGNCVSACVATFLDVDLERVPHFLEHGSKLNGDAAPGALPQRPALARPAPLTRWPARRAGSPRLAEAKPRPHTHKLRLGFARVGCRHLTATSPTHHPPESRSMTQQPYYQPQYPQVPGTAPAPQGYPQQSQAQPMQQFMQPGYPPQGYPQQAPPPSPPLAEGGLDEFYSQPGAGTGPSLSWKDKPLGTTYAGIVARDVTNGDVQQQTDPSTNLPKTFRDGRPMFVMKVPLKVQPSPEFPEGEATFFVRGQARDELVRAMAEAGAQGAPQGGAGLVVRLVQRRPSRGGGNPANIVQIQYTPPPGGGSAGQPASSGAPSPAPEPQQAVQQVPQQQQQQGGTLPGGQPYVTGEQYGQTQTSGAQYGEQPVQQSFTGQPAYQQPQVQQAPQAQAPQQVQQPQGQPTPQPPSDLSPDQQALLARLTGGQG